MRRRDGSLSFFRLKTLKNNKKQKNTFQNIKNAFIFMLHQKTTRNKNGIQNT
jgi:hypothetical protein